MLERSIVPGLWHGITPLFFGYEECKKGHSYGPAIRDCSLIHYVFEGSGTLYKNGGAHSVAQGEIFVILPNEITTYTASEENPWRYCWIAFRSEQPLSFLQRPVIPAASLHKLFSDIRQCTQEDAPDCRIFSLIYELLWMLSRQEPGGFGPGRDYAAYAKTHLENTYMMAVTIEDIARTLHIDRRYLTAVFRKAYGHTPQQYLMKLRLEKSKEFLSSGCSVTEAAAMAGFSDLANFSRKFKQHYGVCPRKCRGKTDADTVRSVP